MNCKWLVIKIVLVIMALLLSIPCAYAGETTLKPNYLASTGDSISIGVNAERFGDNTWASWVNGYHGFWQWLFGLTDVNSHNQRISLKYPFADRSNYMLAEAGAMSEDLADQVDAILRKDPLPTYVTVFIGQNDICRDRDEEITPVNEYVINVGTALDELASNLDPGSTILVVGPVDVTQLFEVAKDKKALGIVDCEVLWFFSLFNLYPCYSVLGPGVDDVDRLMILSDYIRPYNRGLSLLVNRLGLKHSDQNIIYTNAALSYQFTEDEISDRDCFHPSAIGQTSLSELTWEAVESVFPRSRR